MVQMVQLCVAFGSNTAVWRKLYAEQRQYKVSNVRKGGRKNDFMVKMVWASTVSSS
jgi:hypothetical protein